VAKAILAIGEEIATTGQPFAPPVCLLFGGETTVTLRGDGMGGRNQEMALAALGEFRGNPRFLFLSAGTDGIDGRSDAAGPSSIMRAGKRRRNSGSVSTTFSPGTTPTVSSARRGISS